MISPEREMGPERAWEGQRRPRIAVAHRIVGETRDKAKAKNCACPTVPVPVHASTSRRCSKLSGRLLVLPNQKNRKH